MTVVVPLIIIVGFILIGAFVSVIVLLMIGEWRRWRKTDRGGHG